MLTLSLKKSFLNEKRQPGRDRLGKRSPVSLAPVEKLWREQLLPIHPADSPLRVHRRIQGMLRVIEMPQGWGWVASKPQCLEDPARALQLWLSAHSPGVLLWLCMFLASYSKGFPRGFRGHCSNAARLSTVIL